MLIKTESNKDYLPKDQQSLPLIGSFMKRESAKLQNLRLKHVRAFAQLSLLLNVMYRRS